MKSIQEATDFFDQLAGELADGMEPTELQKNEFDAEPPELQRVMNLDENWITYKIVNFNPEFEEECKINPPFRKRKAKKALKKMFERFELRR